MDFLFQTLPSFQSQILASYLVFRACLLSNPKHTHKTSQNNLSVLTMHPTVLEEKRPNTRVSCFKLVSFFVCIPPPHPLLSLSLSLPSNWFLWLLFACCIWCVLWVKVGMIYCGGIHWMCAAFLPSYHQEHSKDFLLHTVCPATIYSPACQLTQVY